MKFIEFLPYIALGLLAVIIIVIASLPKKNMTTKEIAVCAMCLALSFALSYVKIAPVPNGGSITLAAITPVAIYCYFAGVRKGIFCGLIYSLLQLIQEPYILGFFQVLLDYIIPFSVFGIVALMKPLRNKLKGYDFVIMLVICYTLRYFCHVIAGTLYWEVPWAGSFIYSLTYVPIDLAIAAAVIITLIQTKTLKSLENIYNNKNIRAPQSAPAEINAGGGDIAGENMPGAESGGKKEQSVYIYKNTDK